MRRTRSFWVASCVSAAAASVMALVAVTFAIVGGLVLTGVLDQPRTVHVLPGTSVLDAAFQPSWSARLSAPVCPEVDLADYHQINEQGCFGFSLQHGDVGYTTTDGDAIASGTDVRPTAVRMEGEVLLAAEKGWNPLIASLYGMAVLGLAVVVVVLSLLTRVLRSAAKGEPFSLRSVAALRTMGWLIIGWEVAQPVLWLFLSPKAWDYSETSVGTGPQLSLGPMETPISVPTLFLGGLLVLLAAVFRHGETVEAEQAMTV